MTCAFVMSATEFFVTTLVWLLALLDLPSFVAAMPVSAPETYTLPTGPPISKLNGVAAPTNG